MHIFPPQPTPWSAQLRVMAGPALALRFASPAAHALHATTRAHVRLLAPPLRPPRRVPSYPVPGRCAPPVSSTFFPNRLHPRREKHGYESSPSVPSLMRLPPAPMISAPHSVVLVSAVNRERTHALSSSSLALYRRNSKAPTSPFTKIRRARSIFIQLVVQPSSPSPSASSRALTFRIGDL
jgi:hypothetical protein